MLRKIAELEVYVEDDARGPATGCASPVHPDTGEVGMRHKMILNVARNPYTSVVPNVATEFAHELGHFMANTMGTPRGRAAFKLMVEGAKKQGAGRVFDFNATVGRDERVPKEIYAMESEAWDFARLIYPGLNEAQAKEALESYR